MIAPPERRELDALPFVPGYAALGERFVEPRLPTPLAAPYLVAFNPGAAALLDLDPAAGATPEFLAVAAGNALPHGAEPTAAVYAGHQFGVWVSRLGDGRAISLGDIRNARGERWEWQLKGAGMTAFSRFADGRAVLRSTIREYLCSEAMHALGIPTTRALAIAGSRDPVIRETRETAAVLSRLAPTHVRFGTFEYFRHRGDDASLRALADYVIAGFFPDIDANGEDRYARLLREVVERAARLAAQWQAVGFAHGVMNTDNMSILGLTLDYGPFGFMEAYDPGFACNHSDDGGRYAFDRQPGIALWNCHALAAALDGLVPAADAAAALAAFEHTYRTDYVALMREKLGLQGVRDGDARLVVDLLEILAAAGADYTRFFRALSGMRAGDAPETCAAGAELGAGNAAWVAWVVRYRERLDGGLHERAKAMLAVNPKYVLRNYLAQTAIERAQEGDFGELATLHAVLSAPFDEQPQHEAYTSTPPASAQHVIVSCSS
jgi:protein adenylyltransferase